MNTKQKIELIDKVLQMLNEADIAGLKNCGRLYVAGCELERLRLVLEREADEETALQTDGEESEDG